MQQDGKHALPNCHAAGAFGKWRLSGSRYSWRCRCSFFSRLLIFVSSTAIGILGCTPSRRRRRRRKNGTDHNEQQVFLHLIK